MRNTHLLPGLLVAAALLGGAPSAVAAPEAAGRAAVPPSSGVRVRLTGEGRAAAPQPRVRPAAKAAAAGPRARAGSAPAAAREADETLRRARKVFGADDRYEVPDPAAYPFSTVCKVFAAFPDGTDVEGSAVLVGDRHALTAAHVVYDADLGGFAESVEVVPAYDGGDAPFGVFRADDVTAFSGYTRDGDYDWDFALLSLDGDAGTDAGWLGLASYGDAYLAGLTVNTAGYPADLAYGEAMFGATGEIEVVRPGQLQMRGELDASGGQSGSGVWVRRDDGRYVVGVVSTETRTWNQAARVTGAVFDAVSGWIDAGGLPDFTVTAFADDLPREFEAPRTVRATVTVANDGGAGDSAEVALTARDFRGDRVLLARRVVFVEAGDEVAVDLAASVGSSFRAGTWVLEAEVNGDRAVRESDYDDDRADGPRFVVLPPFGAADLGRPATAVLAPGGVARYRVAVPDGVRRLQFQLAGPRGAFAVVTAPDGRRFVVRAGARAAVVRLPEPGVWTADVRMPATVRSARSVRFLASGR